VVAKVELHFGELFPRVGLIVTNLETYRGAVVRFYNKRGMAEQRSEEGKQGGQDDPAELPSLPFQRTAAVAEPDGLQPEERVAVAVRGDDAKDSCLAGADLVERGDRRSETGRPGGEDRRGICEMH